LKTKGRTEGPDNPNIITRCTDFARFTGRFRPGSSFLVVKTLPVHQHPWYRIDQWS